MYTGAHRYFTNEFYPIEHRPFFKVFTFGRSHTVPQSCAANQARVKSAHRLREIKNPRPRTSGAKVREKSLARRWRRLGSNTEGRVRISWEETAKVEISHLPCCRTLQHCSSALYQHGFEALRLCVSTTSGGSRSNGPTTNSCQRSKLLNMEGDRAGQAAGLCRERSGGGGAHCVQQTTPAPRLMRWAGQVRPDASLILFHQVTRPTELHISILGRDNGC